MGPLSYDHRESACGIAAGPIGCLGFSAGRAHTVAATQIVPDYVKELKLPAFAKAEAGPP